MWKWVLIVIGGLVGLVVLMAVIGMFLPRAHVASSSVVLHQPPDSLWKTIRDLAGQPAWWPEILEARVVPDSAGREVWEQKMKSGTLRFIVTESTPPTRFVTLIDAAPGAPFGGSWIYEVQPVPEGSRVTITEDGWVANVIFRFLSRVVFGHHATQVSYLKALGRKFGETAEPVRQ